MHRAISIWPIARNHRVYKIDALTGIITIVAGTGGLGFNGDGIAATAANLQTPSGVAVDGSGNLFIADTLNNRIRKVDVLTGIISTVAGTGTFGFNGDGILATTARVGNPIRVTLDGSGNIFIADSNSNRIRKVDALTGLISTVAGTGVSGFNGDGILATTASLSGPSGVAPDGSGNLFIADQGNQRIRKVDALTGIISTVAGTGTFGFNGDGILGTNATLSSPWGVAVDGSGNLLIADQRNNRIRKVDALTGLISTVAGTGGTVFNGDGFWPRLPLS